MMCDFLGTCATETPRAKGLLRYFFVFSYNNAKLSRQRTFIYCMQKHKLRVWERTQDCPEKLLLEQVEEVEVSQL